MNNIINRYQKNPKNKELEVRIIYISNKSWNEWVRAFRTCNELYKTSTTEQSIHFSVEKDRTNNRKELLFKDGIKGEERNINKQRLIQWEQTIGNLQIKYALSEETPIGGFSVNNAKNIRLRLRISFFPENHLKSWRIDFTFIISLEPAQFDQLQTERKNIFPIGKVINNSNYIDFIQTLGNPDDYKFSWELEMEYIGKPGNLTATQIKNDVHSFIYNIEPDLAKNKYIQNISKLFSHYKKHHNTVKSLKQFVNQPITLSYKDYLTFIYKHPTNYYLSDKADGDRVILCLDPNDKNRIISANGSEVIDLSPNRSKEKKSKTLKTKDKKEEKEKEKEKPKKGGENEDEDDEEDENENKDEDENEKETANEKKETANESNMTILDAEMISSNKFYIFDILMVDGKDITNEPFSKRQEYLSIIEDSYAPIIEIKIQIPLKEGEIGEQIKELYNRKGKYPIDGLIFTPASSDYFSMKVYKWKPPEKNTIDFLIIKVPSIALGVKPYLPIEGKRLYLLLCGINYRLFESLKLDYFPGYRETLEELGIPTSTAYFPIQFAPASHPLAFLYYVDSPLGEKEDDTLHGHVGEFIFIPSEADDNLGIWRLVKMRPDKDGLVKDGTSFGNDYKVAELSFQQYFEPFTFKLLTNPESKTGAGSGEEQYFLQAKDQIYRAQTKFNAFVKAQLISQFENKDFVIDLACGKGQDLFNYSGYRIKNILLVDRDKSALAELSERKYELDNSKFYVFVPKPDVFPNIYICRADLTENYKKVLKRLACITPELKVNGIVMNFAIHYIIDSQPKLQNLINLIKELLQPGGVFVFTCFNGSRIFNLLKDVDMDKSWDLHENTVLKYSIKKLYQSTDLTDFGQHIGVIHPFSSGNYYEENLVNIDYVIKEFEEAGFHLRQNGSFADWLDKFASAYPKIYEKLSDQDIKYISLYQYVGVWKPREDTKITKKKKEEKDKQENEKEDENVKAEKE